MRKIIKNLPAFFLWLAWLIIIAHSIIPHDHHSSDSFTAKEDECPVSNAKTGHSSGFPIHCHAFNDLTSEKATTYFISLNIEYSNVIIRSFSDPFAFKLQFSCQTIIDILKPFQDFHFLELSALRAPPSLS